MMNKEVYLKNVAESLALLSREVSILNAVNLYDINIVAEDFFPGLLNLIYGYELKNANYLEKNAPAIDLVDPKNRIAVQVTSDNSSTKIKHTIEEFNKNKAYQSYDRLIVLILTQKKKYSSNFDTQGMFSFEKERDIWDVEKLMQDVRELETEQIKAISPGHDQSGRMPAQRDRRGTERGGGRRLAGKGGRAGVPAGPGDSGGSAAHRQRRARGQGPGRGALPGRRQGRLCARHVRPGAVL